MNQAILYSTTPASCLTALFPRKENVWNVILTTSSRKMELVSPKINSVRKWTNMAPASNAWIATTTRKS